MSMWIFQITLFCVLLFLSACFSGTETAFFSLNKIQLGRIRRSKGKTARKIFALLQSTQDLLTTILLGNTFFNISATVIFTSLSVGFLGESLGSLAALVFMPLLLLLFGEILPKLYSVQNAEYLAPRLAHIIPYFMTMTKPIRTILNKITNFYLTLFGITKKEQDLLITEREFLNLVDMSERDGIVEEDEKEMITNLIDCSDIDVADIYTPRVDMVALDIQASREDYLAIIRKNKYKHYPVYRDRIDNVVGVVQAKDIFFRPDQPLQELMQPPYFIPDTKRIDALLREMQHQRLHIAIVVDEHGGIDGIVSIMDIIEEIIGGDIHDEHDHSEMLIKHMGRGLIVVQGNLHVDDANKHLHLRLPENEDDYDTVAGFLLKKMGKIPKKGEALDHGDYTFTIKRATRRRIISVMIEKKKK